MDLLLGRDRVRGRCLGQLAVDGRAKRRTCATDWWRGGVLSCHSAVRSPHRSPEAFSISYYTTHDNPVESAQFFILEQQADAHLLFVRFCLLAEPARRAVCLYVCLSICLPLPLQRIIGRRTALILCLHNCRCPVVRHTEGGNKATQPAAGP